MVNNSGRQQDKEINSFEVSDKPVLGTTHKICQFRWIRNGLFFVQLPYLVQNHTTLYYQVLQTKQLNPKQQKMDHICYLGSGQSASPNDSQFSPCSEPNSSQISLFWSASFEKNIPFQFSDDSDFYMNSEQRDNRPMMQRQMQASLLQENYTQSLQNMHSMGSFIISNPQFATGQAELNVSKRKKVTTKSLLAKQIQQLNPANTISSGQCIFTQIFKFQKIKGRYHKNTNVPKVLVRLFLKYFYSFIEQHWPVELKIYHEEIKKTLVDRSTNNYNISHILQLLGAAKDNRANTLFPLNRKVMWKIIDSTMVKEIILNNFIKRNEMTYLIALKIYALRCRSAKLVQRVKIL